jgi:hypothetical protein
MAGGEEEAGIAAASTSTLSTPNPSPPTSGGDVFASRDFDSVDFINRLFPDETSLSAGVDPLISKLKLR